jgi:hypothetical protein
MIRPPRHEGQVTWPKLQRSSRIFEPEPGPALDDGVQGQLDRPGQAQSPRGPRYRPGEDPTRCTRSGEVILQYVHNVSVSRYNLSVWRID